MVYLQKYKCPGCGHTLQHDNILQKAKCPYCAAEFSMQALKSMNKVESEIVSDITKEDIKSSFRWEEEETEGIKHYMCKVCGGEVFADDTTEVSSCPYCGNSVTITGNLTGEMKPDFIIPFKMDKKEAKEEISSYYKRKWVVPGEFWNSSHIDEIREMYIPLWLFSSDINTDVVYNATTVHKWSDLSDDITETGYYRLYRSGNISFSDIPIYGSRKISDDLMKSLEPYDLNEPVDFHKSHLSGYLTERYDENDIDIVDRVNKCVKNNIHQALSQKIQGYATIDLKSINIQTCNSKVKYVLLPVWLLSTTWEEKEYILVMNGQNGKIACELPELGGEYLKWVCILTAILLFIFTILFYI